MSGYEICIFLEKNAKLFANSGDPDQMLCSAASDLGLHCLPITLLWVSRLQWVKVQAVSMIGEGVTIFRVKTVIYFLLP